MATPEKTVIAAFDFDGTLTRRDSLLPFLLHLAGPLRFSGRLAALMPTLGRYALGRIPNDMAKERLLTAFLAGHPLGALQDNARRFAQRGLPRLLRPDALARLDWHRRQGHRCVLVSASLELYLEPWGQQAGFDHVIASRLEISDDGTATGRLAGANCFGAEKVARLEQLLGPLERHILYAYGDSRGDRELLLRADYAYFRRMPQGETP